MWLNAVEIELNGRLLTCLREVRKIAADKIDPTTGEVFTTLAKIYNAQEEYPGHLTAIARQGSGSASRSMFGGFVRWEKGTREDGTDSIAVQVADENVRES